MKEILKEYEDWFCDLCNTYESLYAKPMYACQISVALHAAVGMATFATPDGRAPCAIRHLQMVPCLHILAQTGRGHMLYWRPGAVGIRANPRTRRLI